MARYIEYYEYKDIDKHIMNGRDGELVPDYYRMTKDKDAINKKNLDHHSYRIWKYDTKNGRVVYERNDHKGCSKDTPVDMDEFYKIVVLADECPYSDFYIFKQERHQELAQLKAAKK